jgi:microcystin-dependent protein
MADIFVGEIRLFAFGYAPEYWLDCSGQTLAISTYNVLYAVIGTMYGGDGVSNFRLPDLQGRFLISSGTGTGLTPRTQGQAGGEEAVTLTTASLPYHSHSLIGGNPPASLVTAKLMCSSGPAVNGTPANETNAVGGKLRFSNVVPNAAMRANSIKASGRTDYSSNVVTPAPHDNMPPFLTLRYCICYNGIFPQHS